MTSSQDSAEFTLHTPLCNLLGIKYPIIQAGMAGGITSPELVSAVSNAGGLGVLGAARLMPDQMKEQIRKIRSQTSKPFGVNLLLAPPEGNGQEASDVQNILNNFRSELGLKPSDNTQIQLPESKLAEQIDIILEERVPVLSFGLGNPKSFVGEAHSRGVKVMAMVTTVAEAKEVIAGGSDAVVAQGGEAGGHRSTFKLDENGDGQLVGTMALVPQIVDVAGNIPILAAGGIMDGRGMVASLALGAQGVQLGTRFLTARESGAFPAYKKTLLESTEVDTVITRVFTGRPARAVRNHFVDEFENSDVEPLNWPYQAIAADDIYIEAAKSDNGEFFPLLAGQGLGLSKQEHDAAQIVSELVREASEAIDRLKIVAARS
jgi:nitronate monooxygenase